MLDHNNPNSTITTFPLSFSKLQILVVPIFILPNVYKLRHGKPNNPSVWYYHGIPLSTVCQHFTSILFKIFPYFFTFSSFYHHFYPPPIFFFNLHFFFLSLTIKSNISRKGNCTYENQNCYFKRFRFYPSHL